MSFLDGMPTHTRKKQLFSSAETHPFVRVGLPSKRSHRIAVRLRCSPLRQYFLCGCGPNSIRLARGFKSWQSRGTTETEADTVVSARRVIGVA